MGIRQFRHDHSVGSAILQGAVIVILLGASGTVARAVSPVEMKDPKTGEEVFLHPMENTFTSKFKILDTSWSFDSAVLYQKQSGGAYKPVDSARDAYDAYDDQGVLVHSYCEFTGGYPSGTGFKIEIKVTKMVPDPNGGLMEVSDYGIAYDVTITRD